MTDTPRRLLVTGAAGFIGSNLVLEAALAGWHVCAVDNQPESSVPLRPWREDAVVPPGSVVREKIDLLDRNGMIEVVRDFAPHAVAHLGARTDLDNEIGLDGYRANTDGVQHVMAAVQAAGSVERVIWASSRLVFAIDHRPASPFDYKPSTQYGVSKVAGEVMVRDALGELPHSVIVRPTSIWGPGFGEPYLAFFRAVLAGRYVHPYRRRPLKSFGYVENSCYQLLQLLTTSASIPTGATFMLGDYEPLDLQEWASYIARSAGARTVRRVPMPVLRGAALVGDRLRDHRWPLTTFRLDNLVTDMQYDLSDLRAVAPDLPVSWQDGVHRTLAWMAAAG